MKTPADVGQSQKISSVILTGGAGRRVGGYDKGLLKFHQKTLIQRQIDWLRPQVAQIMISANRSISVYRRLGFEVLRDNHNQLLGPLQGVLQGLKHCQHDWLFVQPVDMPYLPDDLLPRFFAAISDQTRVAYLASNLREHYLSMLLQRQCLPQLETFLDEGGCKVKEFLKNMQAEKINLGLNESAFTNLNYAQDFLSVT